MLIDANYIELINNNYNMNSKNANTKNETKLNIDHGTILCIFKEAMKIKHNITSIKRIYNNYGHACWRINTNRESYVFKISIRRSSPNEFMSQIKALELAAKFSIPSPEVLVVAPMPNELNRPYYIQKWIPGVDGDEAMIQMSAEERYRFAHQFGSVVGRMHMVTNDFFSEDIIGLIKYPTWVQLCKERFNGIIDSIRMTSILPERTIDIVEERVYEMIQNLSSNILPSFTHGDLHLKNTIYNKGNFTALLDFESSKFCDPFWDFVKLDTWVFNNNPDLKKHFLNGYDSVKPLEHGYEERIFLCKGIEYMYSIRYFGMLYPDSKMLNSFIRLLEQWIETTKNIA